MKKKEQLFSAADKIGFFLSTLIFLISLPLAVFISAIPIVFLFNAIPSQALAVTIAIVLGCIVGLVTLVAALVQGMAISYGMRWLANAFKIPQFITEVVRNEKPIDASHLTPLGGIVGGAFGVIIFLLAGSSPALSIASKVEHLFPAPLVLDLTNIVTFNISHAYGMLTGFLTVALLFFIAGVGCGSVTAACVDRVVTR